MIMISGARTHGRVRHYGHSAEHTFCGRYMVAGLGESLRDCLSCVRIGKLVTDNNASELELLAAQRYGGNVAMVREVIAKPRSASQLMFLREILASTEDDGLDPAWRALCMLWEAKWSGKAVPDMGMFRDPKRNAPKGGGNVIDPKNARPARSFLTENQTNALNKMSAFENSLIKEIRELEGKECPELELIDLTKLTTRTLVDAAFKSLSASLDKLKAKRDELKRAARVVAPVAAKGTSIRSGEMVKGGVYELNGDLYRYAIAQRSGYAYALKWDGAEWNYDLGKGIVRKLTPEMAISAERAAEWGHTHHCCVFCSRPLNDPRSEDAGYGSTCADNYGLPWG